MFPKFFVRANLGHGHCLFFPIGAESVFRVRGLLDAQQQYFSYLVPTVSQKFVMTNIIAFLTFMRAEHVF